MRIGSLFSGYGGLDMGVKAALGEAAQTSWFVEYDKAPAKILAHHWPDVPNYGDITKVDWSQVEPVDILTGGSPCQDLSHAGRRQGMTEGTRSNLWVAMREAIAQLRPSLVVWENVRGAYSAAANSAGTVVTRQHRGRTYRSVVYEGGLLEDADGGPTLRALGRVLGDLTDLGYDCRWHGLRAADVGAPHGRFRVFLLATDPDQPGLEGWHGPVEPAATAGHRPEAHPGRRGAPRCGDASLTLLPTPTSMDSHASGGGYNGQTNVTLTDATVRQPERWSVYADAIARWEALTRLAPAPTQLGKRGTRQLSPAFSEWLMGLPAGHVTDVPGLSRNDQLKALGNGVVPQQAAAAVRCLLGVAAGVAA